MIYHDRDTPQKAAKRELKRWYKEHGICVNCGQNEVYLPRSKTLCLQCLEDQKERHKNREISTEQRYRENMHNRRRYDLCVAFGVCTKCAKRDVSEGHTICNVCLAKMRIKKEKKRRKNGILPKGFYTPTICENCHKEKPDDGRKLCPACYKQACTAIALGRSKANNQNHIWRRKNEVYIFARKHDSTEKERASS